MIIKHVKTHYWRNAKGFKGLWAFFLDFAFWMLIGWADKLIT